MVNQAFSTFEHDIKSYGLKDAQIDQARAALKKLVKKVSITKVISTYKNMKGGVLDNIVNLVRKGDMDGAVKAAHEAGVDDEMIQAVKEALDDVFKMDKEDLDEYLAELEISSFNDEAEDIEELLSELAFWDDMQDKLKMIVDQADDVTNDIKKYAKKNHNKFEKLAKMLKVFTKKVGVKVDKVIK